MKRIFSEVLTSVSVALFCIGFVGYTTTFVKVLF